MIFTNDSKHGGPFKKQFCSKVKEAKNLVIAAGYFGASLVDELSADIVSVSKKNDGRCRILLGMVFHGGLSKKQFECLSKIDEKLQKSHKDNGVFISRMDYHGKVYLIDEDVYVGSSNFSNEGFSSRLECTALIIDSNTRTQTVAFVNSLFVAKTTVSLGAADLTRKKIDKIEVSKDYRVKSLPDIPVKGKVMIKLRVDEQPASSLNLFFDKGRKNKNGKYAPRPWYEVEITSATEERKSDFYPISKLLKKGKKSRKGTFNAFVRKDDQYFKIEMHVASDGGKAIMSSKSCGGRETLGIFIKGKLEDNNLLKYGERITSETLDAYGRDFITLKKLDDKNFILEF